jgi:hypothetical protein
MRGSIVLNAGSGFTRPWLFGLALVGGALALALPFGGSALAASCPAFPAPVVQFTPMQGDMARDTSKSATELGSSAKPMPVRYERELASSLAESVTMQTQPDGTVCAALSQVNVKLGFKRKMYVAEEFAGDGCVADTIVDYAMPLANGDDAALAQFGSAIGQTYAAEFTAISTDADRSQDAAKQALATKVATLWQGKIYPSLVHALDDAARAADMGHWQKAACNGATAKAFAAISAKSAAMSTPFVMPKVPVAAIMDSGSSNMMGGGGMGMGH